MLLLEMEEQFIVKFSKYVNPDGNIVEQINTFIKLKYPERAHIYKCLIKKMINTLNFRDKKIIDGIEKLAKDIRCKTSGLIKMKGIPLIYLYVVIKVISENVSNYEELEIKFSIEGKIMNTYMINTQKYTLPEYDLQKTVQLLYPFIKFDYELISIFRNRKLISKTDDSVSYIPFNRRFKMFIKKYGIIYNCFILHSEKQLMLLARYVFYCVSQHLKYSLKHNWKWIDMDNYEQYYYTHEMYIACIKDILRIPFD